MRSLRVPAAAVTAAVPLALVLFAAVVCLPVLWRPQVLAARSYEALNWDLEINGALTQVVGAVLLIVTVVLAGSFLTWFVRARRNLDRLPQARLHWGWGWSVVGWLVPFLNLLLPPLVLAEVVRESLPAGSRERTAGAALAWGWWLALLGGLGSMAVERGWLEPPRMESFQYVVMEPQFGVDPRIRALYLKGFSEPSVLDLTSLALLALAGLVGVALVRRVTTAQHTGAMEAQ
jgi:Domain of unknown function (DUF4328)